MRPFTTIAAVLLGFIALMQGVRFALDWPISVAGVDIPRWASAIACLALAWIAVMTWRERSR
jgi:hypothetical protein